MNWETIRIGGSKQPIKGRKLQEIQETFAKHREEWGLSE